MLERLRLMRVGPAPQIEVELAERLNILTGDNGLGKTFILDVAWWALSRTWASYPAWPQRGRGVRPEIEYQLRGKAKSTSQKVPFDFERQEWKRPRGRPPNPGLVLYARVDGGFAVWDPARNYWKDAPSLNIQQEDRPPAYLFSPEELWYGLADRNPATGEQRTLCNGLIRDWVLWQLQRSEAFEQLCAVLKALSPGGSEALEPGDPVRVSVTDTKDYPTLKLPYGTIPIIHASAGAKRILSLAYLLVWAWQEHLRAAELLNQTPAHRIILLVDELEAHLHPRWQRLILPALLSVVRNLRSSAQIQLIAATHAPLVLASIEPDFDEARDKLTHFRLDDGQVHVEDVPWAKQGDAVGWLVSEVFGLKQGRSIDAERAIEAAEAFMRGDLDALPEGLTTEEEIHEELVRVLAGHDPFWPRWIVSREASAAAKKGGRRARS